MSTKWYIFKIGTALLILFGFILNVEAQDNENYDKKIREYKTLGEKLLPKYSKIQYAGGIGFLSIGTGWSYGKNKQWETDVLLGFLPRYSTNRAKTTFTIKQSFIPWNNRKINELVSFDPFSCGIFVNSVLDRDFWVSNPEKYPDNYYFFSTKVRFGVQIGQRITLHIPKEKRFFAKSFTFFYEIGSTDLHLISRFDNKYLKPKDYLNLALGLKLQLL